MIHERDFYKLLGGFIAGEVARQLMPVRESLHAIKLALGEQHVASELVFRIERLEHALGDMPVPQNGKDGRDGIDGKDGAPGKDVEMEVVTDLIRDSVFMVVKSELDKWPKPENGKDGAAGRDGRDGTNGADGQSVRLDDVRGWLGDLVREAVADLPVPRHCVGGCIDRDGSLLLSFNDGALANLGKVVGANGKDCDFEKVAGQVAALFAAIEKPKDGKDGKDGRDGFGFKDMSVTFDGERSLIFRFVLEDRVEELSLSIPFMLYRGVWKQGGYERGDVVTRDGGSFVALADTLTIPGTKDCDWQLCVKRGAEGPRGKQGEPGPQGAPAELPRPSLATWPLSPGNK